jgi:hypothetical protein
MSQDEIAYLKKEIGRQNQIIPVLLEQMKR